MRSSTTRSPRTADPLGPANKLVFAPGTLGGTTAPNGGRLSVGAKSPLTGGIKESNSGGQAAHALARVGFAAVIVEGAPADASALVPARHRGRPLGAPRTRRRVGGPGQLRGRRQDRGEPVPEGDQYATISIGPAGEALAKASGIAISDPKGYPNRFAGRGGLGAVMGSKGLKAIVVSDKGTSPIEHADKDAFIAAHQAFSRR